MILTKVLELEVQFSCMDAWPPPLQNWNIISNWRASFAGKDSHLFLALAVIGLYLKKQLNCYLFMLMNLCLSKFFFQCYSCEYYR